MLSLEPAMLSLDSTLATLDYAPACLKLMMMQLAVFGALVLVLFTVTCRDRNRSPFVALSRLVIEEGPLGFDSLRIDGAMTAEGLEWIHRGDRPRHTGICG